MTKGELIEFLKDVPNDAEIRWSNYSPLDASDFEVSADQKEVKINVPFCTGCGMEYCECDEY